MDSNATPRKLLGQAEQIVRVWQQHPELKLNGVPQEEFRRVAEGLRGALDQLADFQRQARLKANERDR